VTKVIKIICPHCYGKSIKKNGKKYNHRQNYFCKDCKKQFIEPTDDALHQTIIENQRERLQDFQYEKVKALFWKYMDEFIEEKKEKTV